MTTLVAIIFPDNLAAPSPLAISSFNQARLSSPLNFGPSCPGPCPSPSLIGPVNVVLEHPYLQEIFSWVYWPNCCAMFTLLVPLCYCSVPYLPWSCRLRGPYCLTWMGSCIFSCPGVCPATFSSDSCAWRSDIAAATNVLFPAALFVIVQVVLAWLILTPTFMW